MAAAGLLGLVIALRPPIGIFDPSGPLEMPAAAPLAATLVTVRVMLPVGVLTVLIRTLSGLEGTTEEPDLFSTDATETKTDGSSSSGSTVFSFSTLSLSHLLCSCSFLAFSIGSSLSGTSEVLSCTGSFSPSSCSGVDDKLFHCGHAGISGSGLSGESRSSIMCSGYSSGMGGCVFSGMLLLCGGVCWDTKGGGCGETEVVSPV